MVRFKKFIMFLGFLSILVINLVSFLPRFHKGDQHSVGEDVVSVVPYRSDSDIRSVPIKELNGSKPLGPDQRVNVYLRYVYEDNQNLWFPKLTTILLLSCSLIYGAAHLIDKLFGHKA
jgi:hypothetical protein